MVSNEEMLKTFNGDYLKIKKQLDENQYELELLAEEIEKLEK